MAAQAVGGNNYESAEKLAELVREKLEKENTDLRNLEKERNIPADKAVKVIMATALNDEKNVKMAFDLGCTIYSGKPIDKERFEQALKKLGLV